MTNRSIVAKQKTLAKIYERYIEVQIFNWVSKSKFFINISMMCLNTSKNFVFFYTEKYSLCDLINTIKCMLLKLCTRDIV